MPALLRQRSSVGGSHGAVGGAGNGSVRGGVSVDHESRHGRCRRGRTDVQVRLQV